MLKIPGISFGNQMERFGQTGKFPEEKEEEEDRSYQSVPKKLSFHFDLSLSYFSSVEFPSCGGLRKV